ncbi:prolow-density lipoprotein receptor-related protein 1-like isoform X15 [Oncorhynchus keta]|uniref:prolow-density lipoprotein receptor-related protein 1-like isoform X15 n=1 Tax=Oncorhynchus keta TaxID=8018 RepID=UPI00227BB551|nr:prolow-density lipoprotein receptor-related protein 1-like isoform X15 [Oncorhynchus keta]
MAVRCPGGVCLTEDERCDGKLQCSDGSDEPSTCGRTCSEENGGCSHSCVDKPWGALCSCPKGHRLSADGASCLDVDECALPYGPCMHFCVNTPGSFYCHCRDGFQLQGTTYCYSKGNSTKFLTATKGTIGFLNLKTLRFESIQSIGYDPLALAFDLSRSSFYWADDQGNIYKAKEQQRRILYHGQYGVRSLVCDWLTGQLYWTNQKTRSIHVGAADGSGFATVLAKNIDPLELVLLPIESLLFWINKGPGDKITLERSGMDGLKQESLVVLTAQAPRSLTLDVTARRLYWMSDFKKSIETVRVDGSGRYSFLEFFKRRLAQSLAVFDRWFYWTDQKGLWRSPQDQPNQKNFIQRTTLPVLEAYHEQQQPKAPSACVMSGCQLCMLTLDLPAGFTCTCPDDKLLVADGSCEYPRFAYATSTTLNLFELKGKELIKTKLLTTDDVMESFDIDWRGDWVYWANSTGHVMRWNLNTGQTETVPTLRPACVVAVDQKMRNLYWLSCDEVCVGVTNMDQGYPRRLYQSGSEVRDVYLDWQRGRLYLLEAGWILSMRLPGGNPRKVLRVEGHVAGRIVLDLQSNTLLWNTEGDDLNIMSLLKSQTHLAGREWNVPGSIMAAHSPLLVSLFNDVITVWDRRDRRRVHDVPVGPGVVRVIVALDVKEVPPAQPVCTSPSVMCRGSTLCISQTQLCDTLKDCPDGFDEESCIAKCPNRGEFRCKDRRKCIERSLVCDGRAHCHDGSDEIGCPTIAAPTSQTAPLKCRMGSRLCKDGRECVLHSHVCDGEVDCKDGSDEQDCGDILPAQPVCTSPSVRCRGSTLCISQTQLCDTLRDCPDGFDEESCITKCPNRGEFRCKDRRKCIERSLVCDGRAHCHDGSDEIGCPTIAAPTSQTAPLKCRMGSRLCKDGRECVLHSHVCDGEVDCKDGSDEQDCELLCKAGQFQCAHGKKCIDQQQVCDGKAQCQDRSDEMDCFKPTKSCSHRCDNNGRCIPETFICDGERDCVDGSDEEDCVAIICGQQQYQCSNGQCVSEALRCDGHADCGDHSDEVGCAKPPHCPPDLRCPNSHECLVEEWLCDGEQDCLDGSDEMNCKVSPVTCGEFQWSCVSNTQCIPATWRCDGQKDCEDYSDEAGCDQLKCSNQLYQCGSGECVDHSLLCDHIINCPDGSDEGHGCSTSNCSSPGTPQCDQHCVSTPYGPRCICAAGFRLQANGLSCVDVDECKEVLPPVCSHTCLNTHSSFLCRCHHGYLLEPNGHSCKTQDEAHLLASVQNELLVLGLHSSSLSLLSTSQTPVFCVDYDWRDQRVYWVSLEEESIKWTSINTKDTGTLVKGVKSESIAVDWVGRNLYWLDGLASQILAVRLGTSTVKSHNYIVVLDEDLEQPRSLLLLPHKGLMYWSEVGSNPQIERSGMDGSERKVVLTRGLGWPVSLSVDTLTDRIYWADEKLQCIGSVSLEGHNVRLLQLTEMPSPFSVMVFNDMVYWSDTKRRTIQVSHKNTGKNRKVLLKRPGQPFGIRIMHPIRQTNVSSPCEKLQCSHICLLAPGLSTGPRTGSTGPKAVCRCAAGLLLAGDGLTCSTLVDTTFLLLLSPTAVTQIYLSTIHDGVGLKRLPEHHIWSLPWAHQASWLDLAVQERNLYLADAAQGSVDLLKLSSSGLTPDSRVLNLQDDTVMALAVDWVTLNLYWSSRKQPDLHVTTTRGQHTAPLLQLGLQGTTSIALHPPTGRLCFTVLGRVNVRSLPQVDCAFMDGRSQKLLWRKAVMPTSLLFSNKGTRLYWADIGAGVIDSILLDGSGYKQFKADPGLMSFTLAENVLLWSSLDKDVTRIWFSDGFQPKQLWFEVNTNVVALRVYSKTSQKGTNSCSERNGGCSQLCLAYPGGRSCRCGRGYQPVDTNTCSPVPPLQCPEGSRACSDGSRCLPLTKFCNHQTDCLDHSDEIKCWSGVKPQDVSHSKPSPGHAGNTVPPSQDWSGRTTPGGVDVQKLDSESCDAQQCNGHGKCVTRGGETTCQCVLGYHGVFCEEGEGPGVSNAPLTLGILSLIGGVLIAAVIIRKSRARAAARGQSTDKETLMTNMDEQTVYAESFNNDLYDPDQELISSADGTSQHL